MIPHTGGGMHLGSHYLYREHTHRLLANMFPHIQSRAEQSGARTVAPACDLVVEQLEQLRVLGSLQRIVARMRGRGQTEGNAVHVQMPQEPLSTCIAQ